jgi:hypothetical protein
MSQTAIMTGSHTPGNAAQRRQAGMASIIITLITMIVISLIVLGFAAISRREQRQTLDQQLSTQAFYAAESAVEDAKQIIKARLAAGQPLTGKTQCLTDDQGGGYFQGADMVLDAENNVAATCLKVELAPGDLQYDGVTDNNIVVPIRTANPLNRLEITWRPNPAPAAGNPATDCPPAANNNFSSQANWSCGYGVLRLDVVPTEGALVGGTGPGSLMSRNMAAFFVPTRNNASGDLSYAASVGQPNIVAANCDRAAYTTCTANITNLNAGLREYGLRISSLYRGSNIRVAAFSGGAPSPIYGAQVSIDATGRAQDVLRRIQVRVPITNAGSTPPGYAIQSNGSICKRFATAPGYFEVPADIVDADDTNDMCAQQRYGAAP